MSKGRLKHTKVIRYAQDGGFAPGEWQRAFAAVEFATPIANGDTHRVGVQITKMRTIDVVIRIEIVSGLSGQFYAAFKKTHSDSLFKHPKRCKKTIEGAGRPLALLSGKFGGRSARVLVCKARS
ncbi:MAG: hypothetical protein JKY96_08770 [Phycisphaerales bacterium]|nr:hypothetical protein [Phycisphaerales bacterium]